MKSRLVIRDADRNAIARAILADEATPNGEHLYDGEQLVFYCPLEAPAPPPSSRPRVRVRDLLPDGVRIPTLGDYLARVGTGRTPLALAPDERERVLEAYEADTVA